MWRCTVRTKIVSALAVILLAAMLSMLIIYQGLSVLQKAMHELADVKEPISAATYEMEINVNGMGLGVLKYLDNANPAYRELVEDDERDFEAFHKRYLQLAHPQEEKALGKKLGLLYNGFKRLGQQLLTIRDGQETLVTIFSEHFERIDALIDNRQFKVDFQAHDGIHKLTKMGDLESDFAEVGFWLLRYQKSRKTEDRRLLLDNEIEFLNSLAQFNALRLSEAERWWASTIEESFTHVMALAHHILTREEQLRRHVSQFVHIRAEIDAMLDEKLQPLTLAALFAPRKKADQETAAVMWTVLFLNILFLLLLIGMGLLLIRTITRPVKTLIAGTQAVSRGDLTHRIGLLGHDEFGDLAVHFNHMVGELQATTVSKGLLQESEAKLHETVEELRQEIRVRMQMEEERLRLQASLRRNEIMAAMGSLVAGVAHEVRNPLFGISSTLDAFEARFAMRPEYRRYLDVLRTEVSRLTTLMQALLEYGKPPTIDLVLDCPEEALAQAIRACASLAAHKQVHLVSPTNRDTVRVRMDRQRLVQVFQNLLENAIQHSPAGSCIMVEVAEEFLDGCDWVSYTIKDEGPGFTSTDLPRVFEPFFTRRRGGTGLGLSIVQRIIDEHGGSIEAGNRPEGGAVIVARLPSFRQRELEGGNKEGQGATEQNLSR